MEEFTLDENPKVDKFQVTEAVRNYARVGKQLRVNGNIMEAAKHLAEMADNAQNHVLSETSDWFDGVSVKRNMKELKGLTGQFKKTAVEANATNQRLSALYEDMGNILNRYYDIDEDIEEAFDSYWGEQKIKAFNSLCEEEKLEKDKIQSIIDEYLFSNQVVKFNEKVDDSLLIRETFLIRKKKVKRVIDKIVSFIETYTEGMVA